MTIANRKTQAELTDLQMHLLEHSFEWLAEDYRRFSDQFRKHLLRSHPDFVDLLERLPIPQFQFLSVTSLTLLIHSLKNPEHMRVIAQLVHEQEYTQEKQLELYDAFHDALMNAISEIAEEAWSPALQRAWEASMDLTRDRLLHTAAVNRPASLIQDSPFGFATRRVPSTALIVDDDDQIRKTLCSYLEHLGHNCYEAENGAVALHYLEGALHIDVIVTDNDMPVLSGLQLLKALAQKPESQRLPCILCSGNLSRDLVEEALSLGAWAIMAKPYSHEELHAAIEQAIQSNSVTQTLRSRKED